MNKLQPVPLGVAVGVVWAAYVFVAAIFAMFGWGVAMVEMIGSFYLGYGASILGAVVGAVWAFVDGLVCGVVIAWLYNILAK